MDAFDVVKHETSVVIAFLVRKTYLDMHLYIVFTFYYSQISSI